MRHPLVFALFASGIVAGCGEPEQGRGGVSPEEARQLDEAAEMLETPGALDNSMFGNDEDWALPEESEAENVQ